jgi:hypothetical protein
MGPRPSDGVRQERLAPFADIEHDGSGFEEDEPVFLDDRHLPEGYSAR